MATLTATMTLQRPIKFFPALLAAFFWLLPAFPHTALAAGNTADQDPFNSFMWPVYRERFLGDAPVVFDERVIVNAPGFAEDSGQVPIELDASALDASGEPITEIIAWVDLNPIPRLFRYDPMSHGLAKLSLNIRLEQASAVRVAVKQGDTWHVGGTYIEAEGGGCTTPGIASADNDWETTFGELQGRLFAHEDERRLRVRLSHPMDSGLIPSQSAFYVQSFEILDQQGQQVAALDIEASVSANPTLGLHMRHAQGGYVIGARDNNGNRFSIGLTP
ncbi:quinoprotein dehydrogenase-associated SoxYZ-like carrier [Vreelandella alkaliphila]|uniref:quinoprotein dehydrogenase-associated SoxYZ-like carrier n=1 Tax=Vreelandella alkaliphila TaxID=272774 RepID=UPI0039F4EFA2